jgi:hypothetical protein
MKCAFEITFAGMISTKFHEDWLWRSSNIKVITALRWLHVA